MSIRTRKLDLEEMMQKSRNTVVGHPGIEYLEVVDDFVRGRMPVNGRMTTTPVQLRPNLPDY